VAGWNSPNRMAVTIVFRPSGPIGRPSRKLPFRTQDSFLHGLLSISAIASGSSWVASGSGGLVGVGSAGPGSSGGASAAGASVGVALAGETGSLSTGSCPLPNSWQLREVATRKHTANKPRRSDRVFIMHSLSHKLGEPDIRNSSQSTGRCRWSCDSRIYTRERLPKLGY